MGDAQEQAKSQDTENKNSRKRKMNTDIAPQGCEDGLIAEQREVESEASRELRVSQMELEEAVKAKDPEYGLRQIGRVKKKSALDRILIEQVFQDQKKGTKSA